MEGQAGDNHSAGQGADSVKNGSAQQQQQDNSQKPQRETAQDIAQLVASNNTKQLADLFLELKQGDVQQTYELLRGIISMLPMDHGEEQTGKKRVRSDYNELAPQAEHFVGDEPEIVDDFLFHDETDEFPITAVMLIPNDIGLVSHVIGKQGSSVMEIKRRTGAKVQVERTDQVPAGAQDRNVFIPTNVKNATVAVQMVMRKVAEKLPTASLSLKVVVPNELVSKIIGKGGTAIKKLQSESGATVQIAKDLASDHVPVGRSVVLSGNLRQIAVAHYHIMRSLAMDSEFPADWRGGIPTPLNAPRPMMAPGAHPPGVQMMHAHPAGPPQQRYGMQPPPGAMGGQPMYGQMAPGGPGPMIPGAAAGGATTRFEMSVPEYSVSFIIGKKGVFINEMQRNTGTNIEIAKTSENGVDRRVTVTGTPDNIQRATHLLEEKVREWQARAATQFPTSHPAPYGAPAPPAYQQPGAPGMQPYPGQQPQSYPAYPGQQPYAAAPGHLPTQPPPRPYPNYGR